MKKLFLPLLLSLAVLSALSCQEEPKEDIFNSDVEFLFEPSTLSATFEAKTYDVELKSNVPWKLKYFTEATVASVTPEKGDGDAVIKVTVKNNDTYGLLKDVVVLVMDTDRDVNESFILPVVQLPADPAVITVDKNKHTAEPYYTHHEIKVTSNVSWSVEAPAGCRAEPDSGELEGVVILFTPENLIAQEVKHIFKVYTDIYPEPEAEVVINKKPYSAQANLNYAGEDYRVIYGADERWWMGENLRYIPEGKTPAPTTEELGIWNPVPRDNSSTWITDPADIKKFGYLYDIATAVGVDEITMENSKDFEGVQGICPDGWHIPTADEASKFWTKTKGTDPNLTLQKLQEIGFIYDFSGSVMKANSTATRTTNSAGGIFTSTFGTQSESSGSVTIRNKALMFINSNDRMINVANVSVFTGYIIRCINDAPVKSEPEE